MCSAQGVPDSGKGPGLYPGRKKGECSRRGCRWHVWCSCWGGRALPQQHGGISTPPPQPFHPWQILFLLNPTKRGSSFHSSQWCLSWLGTVSLCLPRQKVRPSPKNSMAGKGKTVSLCCLSSPALSLDLPALRGQPKAPFQTLEHKERQLHTQCLQGLSLPCEGKGCLTQTHSAPGM